ncbi:MAG: hypothetical protein LBI42_14345 [Chitinispirillales bacterium]|jgi:hypothetical protein|nr:hypothetical protein [Chitinispirillales bacterium]
MYKRDYELSAKITRLGNRGVRKAIERGKKAGIPIPFSRSGKVFYEMPDGTITDKYPEEEK